MDCSSTPDRSTSSKVPTTPSNRSVQVTNTGADPVTVNLSTRTLSSTPVGYQTGDFCLEPATPNAVMSARTLGTFTIVERRRRGLSGRALHRPSDDRTLETRVRGRPPPIAAQASLLNFALIEPNGTYAAYSLPQGLGDYGEVEVTNPPAGRWTAVFFAERPTAYSGRAG